MIFKHNNAYDTRDTHHFGGRMRYTKPYDWKQIQLDIDIEIADNTERFSSIASVVDFLGLPYNTAYDAIMRGELVIPESVTISAFDQISIAVQATGHDEAVDLLKEVGYPLSDWSIKNIILSSVTNGKKTIPTHRFNLIPKVLHPQKLTIKPVRIDLGAEFEKNGYKDNPKLANINFEDNLKFETLVIPDIHFGFGDGNKTSHNKKALEAVLDLVYRARPEQIILLGDLLDLSEWSTRFTPDPDQIMKTQEAFNGLTVWLAKLRTFAPNSTIVALEGNHDLRFKTAIMKLLPQAYGLRTKYGGRLSSLAEYIDFDALKIKFIEGYPDNFYWIDDRTIAVHGDAAASVPGKTASTLSRPDSNIVFGHIHRQEMIYNRGVSGESFWSFCPGTLCKINGDVPGSKKRNNWQVGIGWIATKKNFTTGRIVPFADGRFSLL